jgi:hypothetical protein
MVIKTLRFQSLALVASMGLCAALISGCNPEEPAKAPTPAPTPPIVKPSTPPKTETTPPSITPPKATDKTK